MCFIVPTLSETHLRVFSPDSTLHNGSPWVWSIPVQPVQACTFQMSWITMTKENQIHRWVHLALEVSRKIWLLIVRSFFKNSCSFLFNCEENIFLIGFVHRHCFLWWEHGIMFDPLKAGSATCSLWTWHNWVVVTGTIWPTKPRLFILWPFTK